MQNEKIDFFIKTLGELSAYLVKVKHHYNELETKAQISDAVENYLDGFFIPPRENVSADAPPYVDSQLNIRNKRVINQTVKQGEQELTKLKYGQGSIKLRTRYNKNGTIYKYYEGSYTDETGRRKYVYAKTLKDCVKLLREANPIKQSNGELKKRLTLQEWMQSWYNDFKKPNLRHSSQIDYEREMQKIIFPALGNEKISSLTTEKVQSFLNTITAGNTRKKIYLLISACLKKAVILKKVSSNVCDAVELPKVKKQKRRPFEYNEQALILTDDSKTSQAFFFLCVTGLRVGEFLALTKDDFYHDKNCFVVNKAIVHGITGETKSESSNRIVYFVDALYKNFDLNLLGTFTYEGIRQSFSKLLKKNNITGVSLHSTRHTFATVCHSFGMNDKMLQSLLGHSTLAMTQDVYTHLMKKGSSKIRDYLQELCTYLCTQT